MDHAHRGKGYGRAIMLAGEEECRRLGYTQLDLNVFGQPTLLTDVWVSAGGVVCKVDRTCRVAG